MKPRHINRQALRPTMLALAIAQSLTFYDAHAANITVTTGGDSAFLCSLRKAVNIMNTQSPITGCEVSGTFGVKDTITFESLGGGLPFISTVNLSDGQIEIDRNLEIIGGDEMSFNGGFTTIQSNGNGRIFNIDEAAGQSVTLRKLTLSGGSTTGAGGAIYANGVNLSLAAVTISGNTADLLGGGIYARLFSTVNLNNSVISGNESKASGGGLYMRVGVLDLSGTEISGNTATSVGGGIAASDARINTQESVISGNQASAGGAIYANNSTLDLANTTLKNNTAIGESNTDGGGALLLTDAQSTLSMSNSTLADNTAFWAGGGIQSQSVGVEIKSSTLSGNTSSNSVGGGMHLVGLSATVLNSTISHNIGVAGGGVNLANGTLLMVNSTLSANVAGILIGAPGGGGISSVNSNVILRNSIVANSINADCRTENFLTFGFNSIIEDGSCGTFAAIGDPKLGLLANNGGPTKTHALIKGSIAIDAGDDDFCNDPGINNLDQRGVARPEGPHCDIGAYEGSIADPGGFFVIPAKNGKTVIFSL